MSSRPHSTAATDGAAIVDPQQTLQVPQAKLAPHDAVARLPASAASPALASSPEPPVDAEQGSLSEKSEATVHTRGPDMAKAAAGNVVRLVALPNYQNRPLVHMECTLRHSGTQECFLHREDDSQEMTTMGDVLRDYSERIESIQFDATALPGTGPADLFTYPATLPFPLPPVVTAVSDPGSHAGPSSMPFLTSLRDITITVNRTIFLRSLLEFLHYCPMLRRLAIHSKREYSSVFPEDIEDLVAPGLPYLEELTIDGLHMHTTEVLLDQLFHSFNESTKIEAHFYETSFPGFKYGPALQKLLLPIRHANFSYACLAGDDQPQPQPSSQAGGVAPGASETHVFTFSDPTARLQLSWHWTPDPNTPPNMSHVGLACLENVTSASLTLCNVQPSYVDLFTFLQSCRALKRVDVHASHTVHASPAAVANPAPAPAPEAPVPSTSASTSAAQLRRVQGGPSTFTSQYSLFRARRGMGNVLRHIANMPLLFSVAVAQAPHAALGPRSTSLNVAEQRPRSPLAGMPPGRLERLVRYYYEPLWALMVRTSTRWEP
ncbi:hypothetical protein L226DRAFT_384271 [Lentinus tigrinus ALCF2SS1-7]|uniref:Uncharacterized protein n=1 Tax=Lentinus tigrinus ALCF2SS1-6 TaxID=1328759 RepID=A0A5C2SN38_9APHY|nr:hypothetical protein L227DRAFT_572051 [Lentinus tigrinus ALCF2SS1-6]RPD76722.1 hypothetical protein L226DRAFT_384271 [Lentinus tigrinus ALCF2SS1-7]